MCPYWMASATSPPGRRAMCQASVRRKRASPIAPYGSSGTASWSRPRRRARAEAQVANASMRPRSPFCPIEAAGAAGVFLKACTAASNRSPPSEAIISSTRIALTTGGIATGA